MRCGGSCGGGGGDDGFGGCDGGGGDGGGCMIDSELNYYLCQIGII